MLLVLAGVLLTCPLHATVLRADLSTSGLKLLATALPVMTVTEFTWTGGGGGNHSWSTPSNWSPSPSCSGCYPNDCQHNAVIPYQSGGWDIELVSEQIHLVDIAGDVDFTGTGSIPVLEVEELVLTGDHDVVITFTAATMKTMSCP